MESEGDWQWVGRGTALSHTNWRSGQPNNQKERQHCAYMHVGKIHNTQWDDWACREAELNFVCEI